MRKINLQRKKKSIQCLFFFLLIIAFGCTGKLKHEEEEHFDNGHFEEESIEEVELEVKTFYDEKVGWGYDIFMNGKQYIHQPHIPGINGIIGFTSEKDALAVAGLMMEKISNNIMPPGVSVEELKILNIIINNH